MKSTRIIGYAALIMSAFWPNFIFAEDIDLYTGSAAGGDTNVVIVLDNESNWSSTLDSNPPAGAVALCGSQDAGSYFCAQKYALIQLLQLTDSTGNPFIGDKVGVGIMMYGAGQNKGGFVRFGVRKMTTGNRAALITLLRNLDIIGDKGSSTQDYGWMMWEAFKYFGGGTGSPWSETSWGPIPTNGLPAGSSDTVTLRRDYAANATAGSASAAGAGAPYAYTSSSTDNSGANPPVKYNPPVLTESCGKNYLIYIGHSDSQANNNNADAQALFMGVGGSSTRVSPGSASSGDEGARYLFNSDVDPTTAGIQNVITYTIGTYSPPATGQIASMISTMKSMAAQGGGSYYDATNIQKLADTFKSIFAEIQSINSVFVSASLPVSANTQGTYLNQVFVGMFRPDAAGTPTWLGNLKQYQLKYDDSTNTIRLADGDNNNAIDGKGSVSVNARSFWTSLSTPNFWTNWVPTRTPTATDSPDGPEVQKGGAAQRQREVNRTSQADRNIYTCPLDASGNGACVTGTPLTSSNYKFGMNGANPAFGTFAAAKAAPAFNLPSATDQDITDLIAWVRGTDNLGNESGPGGTTTIRPTIHGDVLHSRPVALNFSGRVVVFYGSNDGMVRAIEGTNNPSSSTGGNELWAFTPPELLNQLNRLRLQTPKVILPSSTTDTSTNKSYFLDGAIGAYQDNTTAIIYVSARRGGNFIYAIDVSSPDNPTFKFKLSPVTAGMSGLGQTWSVPKVTRVRDNTPTGRTVLIFGGGYDPAEDTDAHGTTGRAVYVVDALTGAVIKQFLTTPAAEGAQSISTSIPSEITIVNSDRDSGGFVDIAYVGDLAGNVWRMDLDDGTATNDPSNWKLHKLASLGARKFFFPPDIVLAPTFHAVLIGSGDREKPLSATSSDKFYMLKDTKLGLDGSGQATILQSDLALNTADSTTTKGWYYNLNASGEKVVNAPLTIGGVVYFGTNKPIAGQQCQANLGEARSYALNFNTGAGVRPPGGSGTGDDIYSIVLGDHTGLPPSPVAGLVDLGNGVIVPFCIGCGDRRSGLEAGVPTVDPMPLRRKIYWKIKNDK